MVRFDSVPSERPTSTRSPGSTQIESDALTAMFSMYLRDIGEIDPPPAHRSAP